MRFLPGSRTRTHRASSKLSHRRTMVAPVSTATPSGSAHASRADESLCGSCKDTET